MRLLSRSKHPFHLAGGWESPGAEWAVHSSSRLDPVPAPVLQTGKDAEEMDGKEKKKKLAAFCCLNLNVGLVHWGGGEEVEKLRLYFVIFFFDSGSYGHFSRS